MTRRFHLTLLTLFISGALLLTACDGPRDVEAAEPGADRVPAWAADAVWYQIFPERFRNGDRTNDPTFETLEFHADVPDGSAAPGVAIPSWRISPWTGDWYARDQWEREMGPDFYENGVFHRRYGGDLQGVIDQLDYLQDLGVNALYFNPVFWARSLHKYDGNSFHHIEPHFGPDPEGDFALMAQEDPADPETWVWTRADRLFLDLLDGAHVRGMRVIIDGVFNHTGRDFFAFADLRKNQQDSPYADWYVVEEWKDDADPSSRFRYQSWWGFESLPEFAQTEDNLAPGPREYVFNATRRWMRPVVDGEARRGIDGWRLDVANEVPNGFWREWHRLVRDLNPEAYTVAEIWDEASDYLADAGFSATMNYHAFAYPVKGFLIDHAITPGEFGEMISERKQGYPEHVRHGLQNLIDSHDTDRVASMIVNRGRTEYLRPDRFDYDWGPRVSPRNDPEYNVRKPDDREREIQRLVALFQMSYVGAPMIYYGTEAGMWGADDPDVRKPMVWPDLVYDAEQADPRGRPRPVDEVRFDDDLFGFYRAVIALRHRHPSLRRGTFEVIAVDDAVGALAFAREYQGERLLVVINRGDGTARLDLPEAPTDLLMVTPGGQAIRATGTEGGGTEIAVPARTGAVYNLQR
jgi:cyclomaltodextrinase / maltogenic alpha-amylase / neopullulanase